MRTLFLFLVSAVVSLPLCAQEKESKWAFGLINGHAQSNVNSEYNLLNSSVDNFYIERYEWFSLRPEIRLITKLGFWSLRLDDFNNGDNYWRNSNGLNNFNIYRNRGITITRNRILKRWNKARLIAGVSFGYNYNNSHRTGYYDREEERRHTMNLGFSPRYSYSISKHLQLEFASEIRIAEFAKVHEAFFSSLNQWSEINDYQYLMTLNGFHFSLNLIYQL